MRRTVQKGKRHHTAGQMRQVLRKVSEPRKKRKCLKCRRLEKEIARLWCEVIADLESEIIQLKGSIAS